MRTRRTIAEQSLHDLMEGYSDHFAMVHLIAKETGLGPDVIDQSIRAFFGYHGIQHQVINNLQEVNVQGLGRFRPAKKYCKQVSKAALDKQKRRKAMRQAINRRAAKKFYYKQKLLNNEKSNSNI